MQTPALPSLHCDQEERNASLNCRCFGKHQPAGTILTCMLGLLALVKAVAHSCKEAIALPPRHACVYTAAEFTMPAFAQNEYLLFCLSNTSASYKCNQRIIPYHNQQHRTTDQTASRAHETSHFVFYFTFEQEAHLT